MLGGEGAIFLIVGIGILLANYFKNRVSDSDTFNAYQKKYPNLVNNGQVKCFKCGGHSVWMQKVSYKKFSHTCRTCGEKLYSSKA